MRKVVTSLVLIMLGAGFSIWGWIVISHAYATLSWPTVKGVITFSSVITHWPEDTSRDSVMYSTDIQYSYKVKGQGHKSERVSLGDYAANWKFVMEDEAIKYPKGKKVVVYFDPANSGEALLEPGPVFITFIPFVFGVTSILIGLLAILRRNRPPQYIPGQGRTGLTKGGKYSEG